MEPSPRGVLVVLSAPLGLGKATLCQAVLDREPNVRLSISCTTRPPREREAEGYDYFFISQEEFEKRVEAQGFLEWVRIGGHYFGTPREQTLKELNEGRDVLLNVDTRGAQAVKQAYPEAVSVFVCPSTIEALTERLRSHGVDSVESLAGRLKTSRVEIAQAAAYDYVLIGENLVGRADDLSAILRAERLRALRADSHIQHLTHPAPAS
jgi:guanylate kinase